MTLELSDELVRELKLRAVTEHRRIKDVATDALRKGLAADHSPRKVRHRVTLPLVRGTPTPPPEEQVTPERVADILMDQEVDWLVRGRDADR